MQLLIGFVLCIVTVLIGALPENPLKRIDDIRAAVKACRLYSNPPVDRIIGGSLAQNEFPWMVALGYNDTRSYKVSYDCGGTLISERFVLTAAHCVRNRPPALVRLGNENIDDEADGIKSVIYSIEEIIKHPQHSFTRKKNDIALIKLTKPVHFKDNISPACLYTDPNDLSPNAPLFVTGWGSTSADHITRSNVLLKSQLQTMPLNECNTILTEYNKQANQPALLNGIDDGQYCAHDPQGHDSCQGDGGGPLQFIPNDSKVAHVVGIISFGISCGTPFPAIHARVAHYLDWIEPIVWPMQIQ